LCNWMGKKKGGRNFPVLLICKGRRGKKVAVSEKGGGGRKKKKEQETRKVCPRIGLKKRGGGAVLVKRTSQRISAGGKTTYED